MKTNRSIFIVISALFTFGCASHQIIVRDVAGNPIEGAKVTGASLSIGGHYSLTNKNGYAKIPKAVQTTRWIAVLKKGYIDVGFIDVNQPKPIIIQLSPQN